MGLLDFPGRVKAWVDALGPWSGRALAFVLGAAAVFAFAPLYQVYVLIPAFSGLLWLAGAQPTRWRAFAVGWAFGAGFFAAGLYWVSFALLVQADRFAWLIPVAIFGFAFGFGLFAAVTALAVRMVPGPPGGNLAARALVLAGTWTVLEWVRGWLFTGFPWNPLGSAGLVFEPFAQAAAWTGVYGVSLVVVLAAASPGAWVARTRSAQVLVLCVAVAVGLAWAGGAYRLAGAGGGAVEGVRLRLVQPNIAQANKWNPAKRESHMLKQVDLSLAQPAEGQPAPTHVIWAETAAPFFIENHGPWRKLVGGSAPEGGLVILGAPRMIGQNAQGVLRVANSLLAIGRDGQTVASYDKFHLVPFGEYVPLKDWLPLERITQGQGEFTPGPGPVTLDLPGLPPLSPLICYEIIFPGDVSDGTGRATWILNLTNDAWYGKTAGPHQHFAAARLRALEEGVPVVRVANTGISGIIDAYGRVQAQRALGEQGVIDGDLPLPVPGRTLFSRLGNGPVMVFAVLAILGGLALARGIPGLRRS